jgi:selenocysteine lyase/cysteine desulfurase
MDVEQFRAEFPVLERVAYLNAGTDGPIPRSGPQAADDAIAVECGQGRAGESHWERIQATRASLRGRIARLLGCDDEEVALTRSATDGVNTALNAIGLQPGDEVVTTDEEHPGVLAPLGRAQRRGVRVRVVPWDELAGAVGPETKLIACSHVSWVNGRVADTDALKATGVPILYDGAQGPGAIQVDVRALGCEFYASAGQKWLCGPDGSGYLYVRREVAERLDAPWPGYMSLAEPGDALALAQHPGAIRFDMGGSPSGADAWAIAAYDVLADAGFDWVHARATRLATWFAGLLAERGLDVAPRGESTLVSWRSADAEGDVKRLAQDGFVVRNLPGRGLVRAAVGAWVTEDELERLAQAVA